MRYWKSKTDFFPINRRGIVPSAGCNSIAIKNLGNGDMIINGSYTVEEGGTFINSMPHPDAADFTEYAISFSDPQGRGVAMISYITALDAPTGLATQVRQACEQF